MDQSQLFSRLYDWFGVAEYARLLTVKGKQEELEKLNNTLSMFILTQGLEELSDESRQTLANEDITDGSGLYTFFSRHIANFPEKLEDYGRRFRTTHLSS